eukprot:2154319-Lingulodinium_polyedra.AAC.1
MVTASRLSAPASVSAQSSVHSRSLRRQGRIAGARRATACVQRNGRTTGRACPLEVAALTLVPIP